ncbi:MAG: O-antigen ligase family protein [Pirellula sp.]
MRELFRIVVYIFVATSLVRRFEARNVIKAIAICLLLSISTCYVGELAIGIFRPWSSDFRMHGTIHASALAHQCLVVCLAASSLALNSSRKNVWRAILIFALITLVFSKTRGALFATLLGMASIQMLRFKVITNMIIGTGIVTLFAGLLFLSEMSGPKLKNQIGNAASLGRSEGVSTLTGRLPLWRVLWRESRHDRVIGVGYGAFFTTKRTNALARELQWFPGHSHNAYFETVLDLGYAGLCILFWLVAATFVEAVRLCNASRNYAYAFVASLMVAGLLDGVVEVMFVSVRELGLFVGMAITMLFLYHPFDMRQAVEPMKNRVF